MSWNMLSRRMLILPCVLKNTYIAGPRIRNNLQAKCHIGYEFLGRCGYSSCSIASRCQLSSYTTHYAQRYRPLSESRRHYTSNVIQEKKSQKMLIYLAALVFGMVGCSYAAVPLYRRFCQATGYGGTVQRRKIVEENISRHSKDGTVSIREIVVQFNADVHLCFITVKSRTIFCYQIMLLPAVRVKPGESALAFYTAENLSTTPIVGISTYNVTPMKAAVYFDKIQCFCFEGQRLLPGEQFETDPQMDGINNMILSCTFFKVLEEQSEVDVSGKI
ncbi:hypothetical protein RND81_05G031100 [Saponaria officinalis]|uniref:Cytochrome c oxidase assembly protein COX11, mitochondrial n=1 Tax=Saponaria officinalis TaxID=3572 RepID=A0AAW1KUC6_SAPOF